MNSKKPTQDPRFVKSNAFKTSRTKWNVRYYGFCALLCLVLIVSASVSDARNGSEQISGTITVQRKPPSTDWVYDPPTKERGTTTYHKWKRDLSDTLIIRVCGTPGALKVMSASRQFSDRRDEETKAITDSTYCWPKDPKDRHTPLGKKRKGGKKTPGGKKIGTYTGFSQLYEGLGKNPVKDGVTVKLSFDIDKYELSVHCENLGSSYSTTEITSTDPCEEGPPKKEILIRKTGDIGDPEKTICQTRPHTPGEVGVKEIENCITTVPPKPIRISFLAERAWVPNIRDMKKTPITNKDDDYKDKKVKSSGEGPIAEDTFATWDLRWGPCPKENP